MAQENTTAYWTTKAREFSINGSTEEAISAYDNASKIDPRNETVWIRKALELQFLGKENESSKAYEKALSLLDEDLKKNPQDSKAWVKHRRRTPQQAVGHARAPPRLLEIDEP